MQEARKEMAQLAVQGVMNELQEAQSGLVQIKQEHSHDKEVMRWISALSDTANDKQHRELQASLEDAAQATQLLTRELHRAEAHAEAAEAQAEAGAGAVKDRLQAEHQMVRAAPQQLDLTCC